jgi:hypothetical protein
MFVFLQANMSGSIPATGTIKKYSTQTSSWVYPATASALIRVNSLSTYQKLRNITLWYAILRHASEKDPKMPISAVISVRPQVTPPTLLNSFEQNWYVCAVQGRSMFLL